ncbi:hypothetical protein [Evansella clarkii]|nr:hypothetical protein [Evansella clarkii]
MIKRFIKWFGEKKKDDQNKSCCKIEIKEAVSEENCCSQAEQKR